MTPRSRTTKVTWYLERSADRVMASCPLRRSARRPKAVVPE
jgi:hypothetical protein